MRRFGIETESIPQARDRVLASVNKLGLKTDEIESTAFESGVIPYKSPEWLKAASKQEKLRDQVVFQHTNYYEGENVRPLIRRRTVVIFDHKVILPDILAKRERIHVTLRRPGSH